jgi:CubicO group peptidase (beta-lactamase class C family)
VTELKAEVEPAEVGLDPERLDRLDRHYRRYVDDGRLPGWLITVSRHGKLAHVSCYGLRDTDAGLPVETSTLWRIFSMTKPVTSVAAMMLYEEGAFELTDRVSTFIPSFGDLRVYAGGSDARPVTVPATEPVRIWHLLTHTAGLTYGFHRAHPVDARYREAGFEWGQPRSMDLAQCVDAWASQPLLFQPGTEWNYSVATDVLGRIVEVVSGQALDEFFDSKILQPLGMTETAFWAEPENMGRLGEVYGLGADGRLARLQSMGRVGRGRPDMLAGGHGLVSTAADYDRFTRMLLGLPDSPAGELDGVRLLGPRTVAYMTRNHLPGGADLDTFGTPLDPWMPQRGVGFGLGFAVVIDPVARKTLGSAGEYSWGGAASTAFFVDPAEQLTASFYTQFMPSTAYPIRPQLRQMIYQAIVS